MKQHIYGTFWALVLAALLTLTGCAALNGKAGKKISSHGLTLTFERLSPIEEEFQDYQIDHPIKISKKMVQYHLLSLWHHRVEPPGKAVTIFTNGEIKKIAPIFEKAFQELDPGTYIKFSFQSARGLIEGETIGTVKQIHWRFSLIHDVPYGDDTLGGKSTWKLMRVPGQAYHFEKTAFVKLGRKNWIVANYKLARPKHRDKKTQTSSAKK